MDAILVLGPSGSGKSTLCSTLSSLYDSLSIPTLTLNLDCANPTSPSTITITDLITLQDIMEEYSIGPNASLLFSFDFLLKNMLWLHDALDKHKGAGILIVDLPGQSQLYLSHPSLKQVVGEMLKRHTNNSVVLQLFDSTHIQQVGHFVSLCMMALSTIVNMELPHICLLSKIDLVNRSPLGMLNDYFSLVSMEEIVRDLLPETTNLSARLLPALARVLDQHSLVSFTPCSVYMQDSLAHLLHTIHTVFATDDILCDQNARYKEYTKECRESFARERMINNLQARLL